MGGIRAHHRRRDLRRALSSAAVLLAAACAGAGCDGRVDAPLPSPDLEGRNARLAEARARIEELEAADGGVAVSLLHHEDARVRRAAALALMEMGERASFAIDDLSELLSDGEPRVRTAAARALGATGDSRATGPLIGALADPDRSVRTWAWKALRALGDAALPAVAAAVTSDAPALRRQYRDEAGARRTGRDELLGRLPSIGAPVAAAFEPAVREGPAAERKRALDVLRRIGAEAKGALPAIAAIVESEDVEPGVRSAALLAVEAIGDRDPSVAPAVSAAASSADDQVAAQAKKVLDAFAKAARRDAEAREKRKKKGAKASPAPREKSSSAKAKPQTSIPPA